MGALIDEAQEGRKFDSNPFNSPLETGVRNLFVLDKFKPKKIELQKLLFFDYLLVHSGDFEFQNSPKSLHPKTPFSKGEWILRRNLLKEGLILMFSKKLLSKSIDKNRGILYSSNKYTKPFIDNFDGSYARKLNKRSQWISEKFDNNTTEDMKQTFEEHLDRWDPEFNREAMFHNVKNNH